MSDVVIGGLFTLAVALIGSILGFQTHKLLRREKYKELIYAQKITIYKQLSKLLAKVIVSGFSKPKEAGAEASELMIFAMENKHLLPMQIFKSIGEIFVNSDDSKKMVIQAANLSNLIRDDLGIEAISQDINETVSANNAILSQLKFR